MKRLRVRLKSEQVAIIFHPNQERAPFSIKESHYGFQDDFHREVDLNSSWALSP